MHRTVTVVLATGLALSVLLLAGKLSYVRTPGDQRGYEPLQPIAFSHRLHAGELKTDCLFCHYAAERSRHAGIPAESVCMNCHRVVTAPLGTVRDEDERARADNRPPRPVVSPELRKLYDALALDEKLRTVPGGQPRSVEWVRVHRLPDFVYFDHRAHVRAGVACQSCHGPVETMENMRQVERLNMGWCVSCHRRSAAATLASAGGGSPHPSTDCSVCHF